MRLFSMKCQGMSVLIGILPAVIVGSAIAADVTYTIGARTGAIRPFLGVNCGPLAAGEPGNADMTGAYRKMGVTMIRTHDYYGPLDMATLYPDRSKDPSLPSSYNFTGNVNSNGYSSDMVFASIVDKGFEPFLRLGDSWNNATPPTDSQQDNWVRAALNVVRHYREGLWNGFVSDFRYIEIWNEPNFATQFWPPPYTRVDFFRLFDATAKAIRAAFPTLRICGPALTQQVCMMSSGKEWLQSFLDYIRANNTPFDALSWHIYTNNPTDITDCTRYLRQELDSRGFSSVTLMITEWNTETHQTTSQDEIDDLRIRGKGAAVNTGIWIAMQNCDDIEQVFFYRGNDTSMNLPSFYGLYTADGRPKKVGLAFTLWRDVVHYNARLSLNGSRAGVYALAAENDDGARVFLAANTTASAVSFTLDFADGKALKAYKTTVLTVSDASDDIQRSTMSETECLIPAAATQLVFLTPTSQSFAVSSVSSGSPGAMDLIAHLSVAASDVGTIGSIYLAGFTPWGWFFYDGLAWIPWSGGTFPSWFTHTLPAHISIPVLTGADTRGVERVSLFVGYGSDSADVIARGNYGMLYCF